MAGTPEPDNCPQSKLVADELRMICDSNGGLLLPEQVVDFARDPETALHSRFCWDDTEAAHRYRIEQARAVIRAEFIILPEAKQETRAYFHVIKDRKETPAGYRPAEVVLRESDWRRCLLEQALEDLARLKRKYADLEELDRVFEAAEKVRAKAGRNGRKK